MGRTHEGGPAGPDPPLVVLRWNHWEKIDTMRKGTREFKNGRPTEVHSRLLCKNFHHLLFGGIVKYRATLGLGRRRHRRRSSLGGERTSSCSVVAQVINNSSLMMQNPDPTGTITNVLMKERMGGVFCSGSRNKPIVKVIVSKIDASETHPPIIINLAEDEEEADDEYGDVEEPFTHWLRDCLLAGRGITLPTSVAVLGQPTAKYQLFRLHIQRCPIFIKSTVLPIWGGGFIEKEVSTPCQHEPIMAPIMNSKISPEGTSEVLSLLPLALPDIGALFSELITQRVPIKYQVLESEALSPIASLVLIDSSQLTSDNQHLVSTKETMGLLKLSAASCQSAPKKPWGYCSYQLRAVSQHQRNHGATVSISPGANGKLPVTTALFNDTVTTRLEGHSPCWWWCTIIMLYN
uniref:Uncharacterized protein n=1 Tax=Timema monikensis TaxID=170555 RepID=A0A7R9HHP4_9NEOP|nr:unnamed protein product [Timema monikensis]